MRNTKTNWKTLQAKLTKFARRERAQSLVEFAVSLPALFLVVTGILIFGIVLYQSISLNQAGEAALRRVVISRGITTDPCATVVTSLTKSLGTMDKTKLTLSLVLNGTTYTTQSCTAATSNMILGAAAQLTLTYPARIVLVGNKISTGFNLKSQEQDKIQ